MPCKINQNNPSNINAFQQSPTFSKRVLISNEACQTGNCVATAEFFSAGFFWSIFLEKLNNYPESLGTNGEGLRIFDI